MDGKWMFRTVALMLTLGVAFSDIAIGAPPWTKLMTSPNIDAEPDHTYALKQENGPWMIMACSFSGEGAEKQAQELVLELRKRYKIEAYSHKAGFKLDDPNGPNKDQSSSPIRWQYRKFKDRPDLYKDGAITEIAVLVGNFPAVDDPEAQKTLQKLKYADPDCLNLDKTKSTSRTLAALRYIQQTILVDQANKKKGPMGHAFITTNPMLPADYYAPKGGVDDLVLRMNKGVTHSLLDCPAKYTVKVATFTGAVVLDQQEIQKIQNGDKPFDSSLAKAAEKAHELTEALRMKGYEAYELHDRYASIVTVGSFDSVGTPRADGKTEINPKVHAIMKTFGGEPVKNAGQASGQMAMKSLAGINFDLQPIPVEVPKRSLSRELARQLE